MLRVDERRRHARLQLVFPATLRDPSGRVLLKGRTADIASGGIRIIGQGGAALRDEQTVWVELSLPRVRASGPDTRTVKMRGQVRRVEVMGEWRSVIVVVFESNFHTRLLDPTI